MGINSAQYWLYQVKRRNSRPSEQTLVKQKAANKHAFSNLLPNNLCALLQINIIDSGKEAISRDSFHMWKVNFHPSLFGMSTF